MAQFRLPRDDERVAIVGRTGSGKTLAALWQLSLRSYPTMPWVIIDYKGDENISRIPRLKEIAVKSDPPNKPGLYAVRPLPHQNDDVENFLWKIWEKENTGLYFDEGYMFANSDALRALLTQGRSKNIPIIILTQRPTWISRFVWSESDFIQLFSLSNARDQKTMREIMPFKSIPTHYHSVWHQVKDGQNFLLRPVPNMNTVLATIRERAPLPYGAYV